MMARLRITLAAVCGIGEATLLLLPFAALADDTPLAETAASVTYAVDTRTSPRAVKTAAELGEIADGTWKAVRRSGEAVTLAAPDGTTTVLAAADSSAAGVVIPLNAGGVWTVENSKLGTAVFTVRRSIDGTLGEGTAASPARIVDGDELCDYGAGEDYVFVLDGPEGVMSALRLPSGYCMEKSGEGVWRLVVSTDGKLCSWSEIAFEADSLLEGPDRKISAKDARLVSYSGDNWCRDATKAATLTFIGPDGTSSTLQRTGTGVLRFKFSKSGDWTVRLEMEDGTIHEAVLTVVGGLTIIVR